MPTVAHVVSEYLAAKQAALDCGLIQPHTLTKTRFYLTAFVKDFGTQRVIDCRKNDLRRFLTLHPEYKSPHSKHDAVAHVVTCFRWAADESLCVCPYSRPKDLPTPQPRAPITADEVRAILAVAARCGYRRTRAAFRVALWFLWETGCRTCELYRLDWRDYDPARQCFELASKSTAKTGANRIIALTARAARLIRWMARTKTGPAVAKVVQPAAAKPTHPPAGPVFLNGRRRPWNKDTFGKLFRRHANRAGVRGEITAYCLRHGFTCEALEAGVGERQLADYLGHSSTRYIGWYGRGVKTRVDYLRQVGEARDTGKVATSRLHSGT